MHRGFLAGFSTTFTIMMIQRWWIDYTRSDGGVRKSNTRLPSVSSSNFHETRRCLTVISRLDLPLLEEGEVEATLDWWSFNNTESMLSAFSVTKNEKGDTRSVFFLVDLLFCDFEILLLLKYSQQKFFVQTMKYF